MSLILDALKKLEREKETRDPGVVVVGAMPWQGARPRRGLALVLGLLVVAVAAVAAVWLLRPSARPPKAAPSAAAPKPAVATTPDGASFGSPPAESRVVLPESRAGAAATAGAPTVAGSASPDLQLNAISEQDGRPVAIVNGRLVREGDSFEGVRILHIRETQVEVEVRGQRRVLTF